MFTTAAYWLVLFVSAVVHRLLPARLRSGFLALISIAYVGSLDRAACVAALAWLAVAQAGLGLARRHPAQSGRITGALVIALLAFLAATKCLRAAVPLGLSYFTFKLVDLLVLARRGEVAPPGPAPGLAYFFLFPAFAAGPMARFGDFARGLDAPAHAEDVVHGLTRIVHGLIKRFLFAQALREAFLSGDAVHAFVAGLSSASAGDAWRMVFVQFGYIYLDFSAYSDLAIGGARLFGIRLPENFDWPILATNLGQLWQRWHVSLTVLCREHVYRPVLAHTRSIPLGIVATMTVISLWHGATLGRLLWGFYQAAGLCAYGLWRRWHGGALTHPVAGVLGWALTLAFFASAQSFTMVESGGALTAVRILAKLVGVDL